MLSRGPELILVNTDSTGAPLALNSLLNMQQLGYLHVLIVAYDGGACSVLADAAARLPPSLGHGIVTLPCLRDTAWEAHITRRKRFRVTRRQGAWMVRWAVFARLLRLGYNVLSFDTDGAVLGDLYSHLHSQALCGRFTLMYASDYEPFSPWLQTGFAYGCGAARDGAAAWVVSEVVDRYLRFADACDGAYEDSGGSDGDGSGSDAGGGGGGGVGGSGGNTTGTVCPPGSWLLAARQYDGYSFDQYIHRGVVHSSAMRDGRMFWSQLEDMSSTAWPWAGNRSACLEVEASARSRGIRMEVRDAPPPRPDASRGAALTLHRPSMQWSLSDLTEPVSAGGGSASRGSTSRGSAGAGRVAQSVEHVAAATKGTAATALAFSTDASISWPKRFGLSSSHPRAATFRRAFWASLRAAVPIATQLPTRAGLALDLEAGCAEAAALNPSGGRPEVCRGLPALDASQVGLLPHRRGRLSRAWQRVLDTDLHAGGKGAAPGARTRRLTRPIRRLGIRAGGDAKAGAGAPGAELGGWLEATRDGANGARWATPPHGDEAMVLLPHWVTAHWTVAQLGIVGSALPRTLFFHSTNANKEVRIYAPTDAPPPCHSLFLFTACFSLLWPLTRVAASTSFSPAAGTKSQRLLALAR